MLSCILNSERAIEVNIQIIRIFTRLREMIMTQKDILYKLEQLEGQIFNHSEEIQVIYNTLKQLLNPPPLKRKRIGFITSTEEEEF